MDSDDHTWSTFLFDKEALGFGYEAYNRKETKSRQTSSPTSITLL